MMLRFIYTLIIFILSPFLLYSLYKKKQGKPSFKSRWKEHFGFTPALQSTKQPIWIHAVSVGEAIAAIPIIKALKKTNPETPILVTTTTSTGAEQVAKLGQLIEHRYMPIDFPFAIHGFLKSIQPSEMIIMETELWPNTLHLVAKRGISISVINARLSEKSYLGYQKVQSLFNLISKNLTHVCCQYHDDADRFIALGITKDKVHITGSIKFDIDITATVIESGKQLRKKLGTNRPIWIAASTHKGEDEKIISAHKSLLKVIPNAILILVPRHPERFNDVFDLCQTEGLSTVKRTNNLDIHNSTQVYLADTMGEMLTLIGAADICFMGGSLLGDKVGGHNILEPAALGKPSLTGPSYFNFQEITQQLLKRKATIICKNEIELEQALIELFQDNKYRATFSQNALNVIEQNRGAVAKTLHKINII
ncbi:MAG: 3-deoxy-D-manno-octulosonic acid transferase [Psychromonas sp.]|nr:3-deoxy-D-manno-octulosonic acid transferase [Alteromonadales bacterium]MCP5078745.1 3-deoxy-D-manno-octulosonic acid transferase [Psychromonas sp.]